MIGDFGVLALCLLVEKNVRFIQGFTRFARRMLARLRLYSPLVLAKRVSYKDLHGLRSRGVFLHESRLIFAVPLLSPMFSSTFSSKTTLSRYTRVKNMFLEGDASRLVL